MFAFQDPDFYAGQAAIELPFGFILEWDGYRKKGFFRRPRRPKVALRGKFRTLSVVPAPSRRYELRDADARLNARSCGDFL